MSLVVRKVFSLNYNAQKENKSKRKLYLHEKKFPGSSFERKSLMKNDPEKFSSTFYFIYLFFFFSLLINI